MSEVQPAPLGHMRVPPPFHSTNHAGRRLISERTCDGIAAARKRGRKPGRPPLSAETLARQTR